MPPSHAIRGSVRPSLLHWVARYKYQLAAALVASGVAWRYLYHYLLGIPIPIRPFGEAVNIAHCILKGSGFAGAYDESCVPTAHTTPVYPYLLSLLMKLFGPAFGHVLAFLSATLLVTAGVLPVLAAPRHGFKYSNTLLGAIGYALVPLVPFDELHGNFENQLSALLLSAYSALGFSSAHLFPLTRRRCFALGLLGGLLCLSSAALALPTMAIQAYLILRAREWTVRRQIILLVSLTSVLVVLPWFVRNYLVFKTFIPLRSNFWLEFSLSNRKGASAFEQLNSYHGFYESFHPFKNRGERVLYAEVGEVKYMDICRARSLQWVKNHPFDFFALSVQRILAYLVFPSPWWAISLFTAIVSTIGMAGLLLDFAVNRKRGLYYCGIITGLTLTYGFVQVCPRYRMPINWLLWLYAVEFTRTAARTLSLLRRRTDRS